MYYTAPSLDGTDPFVEKYHGLNFNTTSCDRSKENIEEAFFNQLERDESFKKLAMFKYDENSMKYTRVLCHWCQGPKNILKYCTMFEIRPCYCFQKTLQ